MKNIFKTAQQLWASRERRTILERAVEADAAAEYHKMTRELGVKKVKSFSPIPFDSKEEYLAAMSQGSYVKVDKTASKIST